MQGETRVPPHSMALKPLPGPPQLSETLRHCVIHDVLLHSQQTFIFARQGAVYAIALCVPMTALWTASHPQYLTRLRGTQKSLRMPHRHREGVGGSTFCLKSEVAVGQRPSRFVAFLHLFAQLWRLKALPFRQLRCKPRSANQRRQFFCGAFREVTHQDKQSVSGLSLFKAVLSR